MCNHPELFERADVLAPFSFAHFGRSGSLGREGDLIFVPYSTRNPIEYQVPELLYLDGGLIDIPSVKPGPRSRRLCVRSLFNIWSTDRIYQSMYDEIEGILQTTFSPQIALTTISRLPSVRIFASLEYGSSRGSWPSSITLYAQSIGGAATRK